MITHPWAVVGLTIGTLGAFGLLRFNGKPDAGLPLSEEQMAAVRLMLPKARRRYLLEIWGYSLSVGALGLGFLLQLIDLLTM